MMFRNTFAVDSKRGPRGEYVIPQLLRYFDNSIDARGIGIVGVESQEHEEDLINTK